MRLIDSELGSAVTLGAVTGMRTFLIPALMSRSGVPLPTTAGENRAVRLLTSPSARRLLPLAAAGELIGDKLPFAPDRTDPPALTARVASAALMAGVLASCRGRRAAPSALIASVAAVASAHLMVRLRRAAGHRMPDAVAGALEDCLALGVGRTLVHSRGGTARSSPG